MNKFIRMVSTACIATMLITTAAGCQSGKSTSDTTTTTATQKSEEKKADVNLRFSWWGADARHKATLAAIDLYKKISPNVTIEAEYGGWDGHYQKLVTQLAGNSAPDIMQIDNPWIYELASKGEMFADMYTLKGIDIAGFDKAFLTRYCEVDGKLQGLPTGLTGATIMYHPKFYETLGISPDTEWTWDKLLEEGKKIHEKDKTKYLLHNNVEYFTKMIIPQYLRQKTGGQFIKNDFTLDCTKEDLLDIFKYIKVLHDEGVIQPLAEVASLSAVEQNPKLVNGDIGIIVNWTSMYSNFSQALNVQLGVGRFPYFENVDNKTTIIRASQLYSINKNSKNSEEAAKFLNWLTHDKEAILALGDVRSVPAVDSARKVLLDEKKVNPNLSKAVDIALANIGDPEPQLVNNAEISQILKNAVEKLSFNKGTAEEITDETFKALTDKLNQLKSAK